MVKCLCFKANNNTFRRPKLKNDIDADALPPLISEVITAPKLYIDNLFAETWKKLKLDSLIKAARDKILTPHAMPHHPWSNFEPVLAEERLRFAKK